MLTFEADMKKVLLLLFIFCFGLLPVTGWAQCSICTRTAQQLGEKPATNMNAGILYLAAPLAIVGVIGYRWWRKNGHG